ncbi:gp436 family protein [Deinococcus cellulosilyticus]|uniref:DUF1320 domain-containing protein n=1 Tax=Deinococcus cellulosilyticus (strain DSM 18568 / NBRC 106333 / KACC 11606 / 5516J-15) TaxID=1223518 RepID=A0A511NB43_DEIC1|nr:DUF1320 domain-containing protein [Deinococcus cellulosilyticus]GEM50022.1 hypothetical protein DC3_56570 [Deinococcus cellulosilyticus NBRC 106333 = KACC 11606]
MYLSITDLTTKMQKTVLLSKVDDEGTKVLDLTPSTEEDPNPQYDRVMQALEAACELADSHIGMRYPVPLDPCPKVVRDRCLDIAIYELWSRKGISPESADEIVERKYTAAVKWLEQVGEGKAVLPIPNPPAETPTTPSGSPIAVRTAERRGW